MCSVAQGAPKAIFTRAFQETISKAQGIERMHQCLEMTAMKLHNAEKDREEPKGRSML